MFKSIVSSVAPFIGTLIGGPVGGNAAKMLSEALLGKPDGSDDELAEALRTATPETLAKIKQLDLDYKAKIARINLEEVSVHQKDRDSARRHAAESNDYTPTVLTAFLFVGFFSIVFTLMFHTMPQSTAGTIELILGSLVGYCGASINFHYGSSAGSKAKDKVQGKF